MKIFYASIITVVLFCGTALAFEIQSLPETANTMDTVAPEPAESVDISTREANLAKREADLAQRESALAERERKLNEFHTSLNSWRESANQKYLEWKNAMDSQSQPIETRKNTPVYGSYNYVNSGCANGQCYGGW